MVFHILFLLMLLFQWVSCVDREDFQDYERLLSSLPKDVGKTEIQSLPGWNGPLPSRMYSGYTYAGVPPGYPSGSMQMHYWFVESENNPSTDPLVVWYNGGPGASSLFGLLVEFGPLLLNDLSLENPLYNKTGIPQLTYNPYSWTKVANVIAVDNPPPVGFSYCTPVGPTGNGTSCGPWNDTYVATSNLLFLVNWFKDFPQFLKNDLYLVGESYAGVYVPTIARAILNNPQGLNLKGFAVGDGCIGTEVLCGAHQGPYYDIEFMHGHGQFSNSLYKSIIDLCPEADLRSGNLSKDCDSLIDSMWSEIGGFYDYNLYDDCIGRNIFFRQTPTRPSPRTWWSQSSPFSTRFGDALNDYPCPGPSMDIWINQSMSRQAINVPVDSYFFSGDNGDGFTYISTEKNLLPFYAQVILSNKLRVLVYNGDTDPGINSFMTQDIYFEYLSSVGIKQKNKWRPWTLDGKQRMGGYVTEFEGNFTFLTIRGSGHMVPQFKPEASLVFLKSFLLDEDYPAYVPQ